MDRLISITLTMRSRPTVARPPVRNLQKQRRLGEVQIDRLVADYLAGQAVTQLTRAYGIHRSTVIENLQRRGVHSVRNGRPLKNDQVAEAGRLHATGMSLVTVAAEFDVDAGTARREFIRAGIATRPRRGQPPRNSVADEAGTNHNQARWQIC